MDEKILQQLEEEIVAEQAPALDEGCVVDDAQLAKNLRADIRVLEEKEAILTEKLCLAKDKGLNEQTDKCRVLLQKLVLQKNCKREELKVVEARLREAEAKAAMERISAEIDELTAQIENEVLPVVEEELEEAPVFEAEYDHLAKSKRLSVISKAFAFVGIFTGLIVSLIYSIFAVLAYVAFEPMAYVAFGVVALVMIVIGLCVGGASNKHKRIAAEIEAELAERRAAYEAEVAERERLKAEANAPWRNENVDSVTEAYAIERAGDAKRARKKALQKLIPDLENEDLKKTVHKVAPIAAACAAVAVVAMVSSGKKAKANKKSAELRREFFNWLS